MKYRQRALIGTFGIQRSVICVRYDLWCDRTHSWCFFSRRISVSYISGEGLKHSKAPGRAGLRFPSREASKPARSKAGSKRSNKSMSIESKIEGSKSWVDVIWSAYKPSALWAEWKLVKLIRLFCLAHACLQLCWCWACRSETAGKTTWWVLFTAYCECLFSSEAVVVETRSISLNNLKPISDIVEAIQNRSPSSDNASVRVWSWIWDRVRCDGSLLCRISLYTILIASDIA